MSDNVEILTPEQGLTGGPGDPGISGTPHKSNTAVRPKRIRIRLTPAQRAAKIAAGWNPPGRKPRTENPENPEVPLPVEGNVSHYEESPAEDILKELVEKIIALENNDQYKSVWLHFFNHGGVFTGPNYTKELQAACDYLNGVVSEKDTVE